MLSYAGRFIRVGFALPPEQAGELLTQTLVDTARACNIAVVPVRELNVQLLQSLHVLIHDFPLTTGWEALLRAVENEGCILADSVDRVLQLRDYGPQVPSGTFQGPDGSGVSVEVKFGQQLALQRGTPWDVTIAQLCQMQMQPPYVLHTDDGGVLVSNIPQLRSHWPLASNTYLREERASGIRMYKGYILGSNIFLEVQADGQPGNLMTQLFGPTAVLPNPMLPPAWFAEELCQHMREHLGLELVGFDMVQLGDPYNYSELEFFVTNVVYFPDYSQMMAPHEQHFVEFMRDDLLPRIMDGA